MECLSFIQTVKNPASDFDVYNEDVQLEISGSDYILDRVIKESQ